METKWSGRRRSGRQAEVRAFERMGHPDSGWWFSCMGQPALVLFTKREYTLAPICCTFPGPLPPQLDWSVSTDDGPSLYIQPILPRSLSMKRLLAFSAVFLFVSLPPAARGDAVDLFT